MTSNKIAKPLTDEETENNARRLEMLAHDLSMQHHPSTYEALLVGAAAIRTQPVQADARDAARYRWLRSPTSDVCRVIDKPVPGAHGFDYEYRTGEELDAAIDAAMKGEG